jgi:CBS domain containing-hemolysin-like protein
MTMSTSLKLTKKLSFEGKINLKDFYRIIEINEEIFEMKKEAETLAGFILEISGNFPVKARKFLFKLFVID